VAFALGLTQTGTLGDRSETWDIRCLAIKLHDPQVLRSHNETRVIAIRLASGEQRTKKHQVHEHRLLIADVVAA
jgi:hypothetical protein